MILTFKNLRKKSKMRVEEVAKYLGVSESAYRKYESSARIPKMKTAIEMGKLFNCTDREIIIALSYHEYKKRTMPKRA